MTEKDYNPEQRNKKAMKKAETSQKAKVKDVKKEVVKEVKEKIAKEVEKTTEKPEEKKEEKKPQAPKVKKEKATMNSYNVPISTKYSMAICKFIKGKKIEDAQDYLEQVAKVKKAIPMKGEIPHRKGMMSGRFPVNAASMSAWSVQMHLSAVLKVV